MNSESPTTHSARLQSPLFRRVLQVVVLLGCLLAAWSVVQGWQWSHARLTSTGCEEEALFPIWKAAQGLPVYADSDEVPFSVSYYNWLFFAVYGGAVKAVSAIANLDSSALPGIARSLTMSFAAACIGIIYHILGALKLGGLCASRLGRLGCSVFLIINPLTGPWLYTARPDIAAIACELTGVWFALRYVQRMGRNSLIASVVCGLLAWSFKQNFVHLLGGLWFFLLLKKKWRDLALLSVISISVAAGTLLLGGSAYRHALIGAQLNCIVNAESAWMFFQQATASAPQLVALAAGLLIILLLRKRWQVSAPVELLASIGGVAFVIGFLGVSKQGADTNYFIPASVFGMIWCLSLKMGATSPRPSPPFGMGERVLEGRERGRSITLAIPSPSEARRGISVIYGSSVAVAAVTIAVGLWPQLIKTGDSAVQIVRARNVNANAVSPNAAVVSQIDLLKQHLRELPGPVFITDRACNLPWIQTKSPHIVYSFMYTLDKQAGHKFEGGGIGGLIEAGYFETLVVLDRDCACESPFLERKLCSHLTMNHLPMVRSGDVPTIDGGRMTHYAFAFQDGLFKYYTRRNAAQ